MNEQKHIDYIMEAMGYTREAAEDLYNDMQELSEIVIEVNEITETE